MRHRKKIKKLGRTTAHRKSMLANMASSLIINEYIVTTVQKAKACKSFTDKVISTGKKEGAFYQRRVEQLLRDKLAADKLIDVLVERFKDRVGGFVSITRLGNRKGDNAQMAKLILVGSVGVRKKKKVKSSKRKKEEKKTLRKSQDKKKKGAKQETTKKGLLDRVRQLRKKFTEKGRQQSKKGSQVDRKDKGVEMKSRSGI